MGTIVFSCVGKGGDFNECSYSGPDVEACFEVLTMMVKEGWKLDMVVLLDLDKTSMVLPVEAFDGQSLTAQLRNLRREWEQILGQL